MIKDSKNSQKYHIRCSDSPQLPQKDNYNDLDKDNVLQTREIINYTTLVKTEQCYLAKTTR